MKFEPGKKRYNDYPTFFKTLFQERVQKLSIDGGFTCPNRDGSKGVGGCSFCNLLGSIRNKDIWLIFKRIRTRMHR